MRRTRAIRRFLVKHSDALVAWLVFVVILFLPSITKLQVLSPNEIFHWYHPWKAIEFIVPQNGLMNDPATSLYTLAALFESSHGAIHWNPHVASGVAGLGSVASSLLSPFSLLPLLLLPLELFYSGLVLSKFTFSFVFGYLWLREESMGKRGAAAGAIIVSAAGMYVVWWLWQGTNATALYPAMLHAIVRMAKGKWVPFWWLVALALAFLVSGFPATTAYGFYVGLAYIAFRCRHDPRLTALVIGRSAAAATIAVLLAAPVLAPFAEMVIDSGYLQNREAASFQHFYPRSMIFSLTNPYRLVNSLGWEGDPALGINNNIVESTIYMGGAALLLALIGMWRVASRARWFWISVAALVLALMFGLFALYHVVGALPGVRYTPLTRLRVLLPLPIAYLAAAGVASIRFRGIGSRMPSILMAFLVTAWLPMTYALVARSYYPFVDMSVARVESTPSIDFLRFRQMPFRILGIGDYLLPNTSELAGLEDIRSHFVSDVTYREVIERISPGSWGRAGTFLLVNAENIELDHPFLSMLNVRYIAEEPESRLIEQRIAHDTLASEDVVGYRAFSDGVAARSIVGTRGVSAIRVEVCSARGPARFTVDLMLTDPRTSNPPVASTVTREFGSRESRAFYIPVPEDAPASLELTIRIDGDAVELPIDVNGDVVVGYVTVPWIPVRRFPDGTIYENLRFVERFRPVWRSRLQTTSRFLETDDLDPKQEVALSPEASELSSRLVEVAEVDRHAVVKIVEYEGHRQRLSTDSRVPFLLASSERLARSLAITLDGRRVEPVRVNALFAGVEVPPGVHEVVFSRRIGRGLWMLPLAGGLIWALIELVAFRRRRARSFTEVA